jgi:dephospho-CoA kinase
MVVGITGGIGAGKTFLTQTLKQMGYAVYNSDAEAKRIICQEHEVKEQIIHLLGEQAYTGEHYNTAWVASQVFEDTNKLNRLNDIVHPAVRKDIKRWVQTQKTLNQLYFVECAILYESHIDSLCDVCVAIIAPTQLRIERASQRDQASPQHVEARMHTQLTDEQLCQRADICLTNDGTLPIQSLAKHLLEQLTNHKIS